MLDFVIAQMFLKKYKLPTSKVAENMQEGRRWLLCVGVNDYGAQINLPNLQCAVNDACLIYKILTREYNFEGFLLAQLRDVITTKDHELINDAKTNGTRDDIIGYINELRRRMEPNDIFIFFFSGHGSNRKPGYLMPFGAQWGKISSYLMYRSLYGELSALPCQKQMLFFDCCYSGVAHKAPPGYVKQALNLTDDDAPRIVAFSATSRYQVTPDKIPGVAGGKYSPFTFAVAEFLTKKVACGNSFDPDDLYNFLKPQVINSIPQNLFGQTIKPHYRREVPEIRPGCGHFKIRRPGLSINIPTSYTTKAGEPFILYLKATRKTYNDTPLTWYVTSTLSGSDKREKQKIQSDKYEIIFNFAGVFLLDIEAYDSSNGEQVQVTVMVTVEPATPKPLIISEDPLGLCIKGEKYEATITITGGLPPYKCDLLGLPEPLLHTLIDNEHDSHIKISGTLFRHKKINSGRIAFDLKIIIQDSVGSTCHANKRLLIINRQDYCQVKEKEFWVGYTSNQERNECIRRMLEELAKHKAGLNAYRSGEINRILKQVGCELADIAVTEALEVNPGSKVNIPEFYIKKYPVTNLEWREFISNAPAADRIPYHWNDPPDYFEKRDAKLPVVNITMEDINAYLAWKGTRLPSAWEWERAARGTDGLLFPWGDTFDRQKCNTIESEKNKLAEVDCYDNYKSPEGVCDMVGNAAEWVDRRVYFKGYLRQPFRGGSFADNCLFALTFFDSMETGCLYGASEEERIMSKSAHPWVGFRDVIDLNCDPNPPQSLIEIPATTMQVGRRDIHVKPFKMACYAVSNLEYWEFIRVTGHPLPLHWDTSFDGIPFPLAKRHLPVVNVRFHDALAFCL